VAPLADWTLADHLLLFLHAWCASFIGAWPAVLGTSIAFGLGHAYQGRAGIARTGGLGLVLSVLAYLSATIWGPMLLHAAIDLNSGWLGRRALAAPRPVA
jgi:membrane protease YdiL (CAAX protease family)